MGRLGGRQEVRLCALLGYLLTWILPDLLWLTRMWGLTLAMNLTLIWGLTKTLFSSVRFTLVFQIFQIVVHRGLPGRLSRYILLLLLSLFLSLFHHVGQDLGLRQAGLIWLDVGDLVIGNLVVTIIAALLSSY